MQDDHSITAMVQFMETDARQKAREYDDEAKQQYESDKTQFVKQETDKVLAQFEQKQKQLIVERRVAYATYAKTQRMRLLDLRNEQLQLVREAARTKLQAVVQQPAEYKSLMLQLLVQGAVAVQSDCVVRVRKVDEGLAKGLFAEAESAAKQQLGGKALKLKLDSANNLEDSEAWGGAVLTGLDGRIICNNTLANRAGNAFQEQLPTIRHLLFHEMVANVE